MNVNEIDKLKDKFVYWTCGRVTGFDDLFPGYAGIMRPADKPLVVMLRGSPGSGKSTLALQLACLGEAKGTRNNPYAIGSDADRPRTWFGRHSRCVFYYTIDDICERIKEKVEAFGICSDQRECTSCTSGSVPSNALRVASPRVSLWRDRCLMTGERGRSVCVDELAKRSWTEDETVLFLVQYSGEKSFSAAMKVASRDTRIASRFFDECVVVFDSITPLRQGIDANPAERERTSIERFFPDFGDSYTSLIVVVDEDNAIPNRDPYITDVLIELWQSSPAQALVEGYCERYLQIVKAANCEHVRGPQKVRILPETGIHVLPSLIATAHTLDKRKRCASRDVDGTASRDPLELGVVWGEGGDKLTVQPGSSTTLVGPAGCLKTPIALAFCREALRAGGKAAVLTLRERPETLRAWANELGVKELARDQEVCASTVNADSMAHILPTHRLVLQYVSQAFMPPEGFVAMVRRLSCALRHDAGASSHDIRIVVDAISDLKGNYPRLSRVPGFLSGLLNVLAGEGVTSLFVVDDDGDACPEDRAIVGLTDNAFVFEKQTVEGGLRILMDARVLDSRSRGGRHVFAVEATPSRSEPGKGPEQPREIKADSVAGKYYSDPSGRLVPVRLRLFVNRCSDMQGAFNRTVCKRFEVPESGLDEVLAHGSSAAVWDFVKALKHRKDGSYVAAVDVAYLKPELLDVFVPIEGMDDEGDFVNLSIPNHRNGSGKATLPLDLCKDSKEQRLRVIPTHADCSLMLCNVDFLQRLCRTKDDTTSLKQIAKTLEEKRKSLDGERLDLPVIELDLVESAAREFQKIAKRKKIKDHFLGHGMGPNPEILVCAFFDLLISHGIPLDGLRAAASSPRRSSEHGALLSRWTEALLRYAWCYLPTDPNEGERTAKNCVFFHTWHSLASSEGVSSGCVPVKLGPRWKGARGGWCWGAIDNGFGARALDVAKYATGPLMMDFLIGRHAGIPARSAICRETGVLSIQNLGLMRRVIEEDTWSRAHIENYSEISNYAYLFFSEFVAFVQGLRTASDDNMESLARWIKCMLPAIVRKLP